jgi:hypothetical protein
MPSTNKASATARGYGYTHQKLRAQWEPKVATGNLTCPRCTKPILPGQPWQLGHTDDRTGYNGPEHARCNLSAGGRAGAAVTNGQRAALRHSRAW